MKFLLIVLLPVVLMFGFSSCEGESAARMAIHQYFPDMEGKALRVANCESGLDPEAISPGGGNIGLFQINKVHAGLVRSMGFSMNDMHNAYSNSKVARRIYNDAGSWHDWSCGRA